MDRVVKETRCLFCSLGCACQVELGEPPWSTAAPQNGDGLCARAFFIGSLLSHPERANLAACRSNGRMTTAALDDALRAVCERIVAGSPSAIIVDGSYPTQAIAAALALAADAPDTLGAVYLPAGDAALLAGLEAAGWTHGAPPGEANDAVLVIGDAFATHPPIARKVLDAKHAARGHQLLVVSPFAGRTAGFATQAATVAPGGEAALLLAVARRLEVEVPGVERQADAPEAAREAAEAIAEALRKAKSPAIVLVQLDGTTANGHIAALAAACIAAKLDAPLLPLFTYGNALGARRAAADSGAASMAEVVAQAATGQVKTLLVIGTDLLAAMPDAGGRMMDAVEFTAVAASFPNATTARANAVLPLGLCCEEEGEVALPNGESIPAAPAAPPIAGALTVAELVERMRGQIALDAANRTPPGEPDTAPWPLAPAPEGDGMTLIGSGDVVGFADGSISSHNWWARAARPEPAVVIHPADCKTTGLRAGATAVVATAAGQARLQVQVSPEVPPGVAAVPMSCPATRALFRWAIQPQTAALACGPMEVTLGAAR